MTSSSSPTKITTWSSHTSKILSLLHLPRFSLRLEHLCK
jgi:hypothetical protein